MWNKPGRERGATGLFWRLAVAVALVVMCGVPAARARQVTATTVPKLQNAAPSLDTLIARFLGALKTKDRKALQQLRVNKREYIEIIMPGSVEPGKERRTFPEDKATYFWDVLNEKSLYSEIALLNDFGGRKYTIHEVEWAKGVQTFDGYKGYAQLRLTVQDAKGESHEIRTGSVAEVGGRYKFVSYVRD